MPILTFNPPRHIAIVMDGNGRWAKSRGLPRLAGHKKGAETLEQIARAARDRGVECLTLYAFSTENWQRPKEEVDHLMGLLRQYLKDGFKKLRKEKGGRIRFIGERHMLPPDIVEQMEKLEKETEQNEGFTLCIALSYGARAEILHAAKQLARAHKAGDMSLEAVDEAAFSDMLYTKGMPDPDILIRTGGDRRISNYLLWQAAYAELFFTPVLWPDFSEGDLDGIIAEFNTRERRYGKV